MERKAEQMGRELSSATGRSGTGAAAIRGKLVFLSSPERSSGWRGAILFYKRAIDSVKWCSDQEQSEAASPARDRTKRKRCVGEPGSPIMNPENVKKGAGFFLAEATVGSNKMSVGVRQFGIRIQDPTRPSDALSGSSDGHVESQIRQKQERKSR